MRIFTPQECAEWSQPLVELDKRKQPTRDLGKPHRMRCEFPPSYARAFVSHHCWVELGFDQEAQLQATVKQLQSAGLVPYAPAPGEAG